jgi:hypothetical protein
VLLWVELDASTGLMTVILLEAALTARVGGGTVTVKASFWMTVRAPPVALTAMVVEPIAAAEEAARVNNEEPPCAVSVTGLTPQEAVTPVGRLLIVRLTAPLNVALRIRLSTSVTTAPRATAREVEAGCSVSVGALRVTVTGTSRLAV